MKGVTVEKGYETGQAVFIFIAALLLSIVLPTTPPYYAGYFYRKLNNLF